MSRFKYGAKQVGIFFLAVLAAGAITGCGTKSNADKDSEEKRHQECLKTQGLDKFELIDEMTRRCHGFCDAKAIIYVRKSKPKGILGFTQFEFYNIGERKVKIGYENMFGDTLPVEHIKSYPSLSPDERRDMDGLRKCVLRENDNTPHP